MKNKAKIVEAVHEQLRLYCEKMEKIAKNAFEQFRLADIPCDDPFCYHGLAEFIRIGRGTMSIEEKENGKKFEYSYNSIPKRYVKKIESIMKNLGIEKYVYSPDNDT